MFFFAIDEQNKTELTKNEKRITTMSPAHMHLVWFLKMWLKIIEHNFVAIIILLYVAVVIIAYQYEIKI